MGESFKLHAEALSGYEDAEDNASTPTMSSPGGVDLGVDAASFDGITT